MRRKALAFLAASCCRHPVLIILFWFMAAAIGLWFASQLQMMSGRIDLLSPDNSHVQKYTMFTREFGAANNIYFVIEGPSLKQSKSCADALAVEIEKHPEYVRDVLYRVDPTDIESKLFLRFSRRQLHFVKKYLEENPDFLNKLVEAKSLNELLPAITDQARKRAYGRFKDPAAAVELRALADLFDVMNSYLWEKEYAPINLLATMAAGTLPFGVSGDPDGYLVGKNGRIVVVTARPNAEKEDPLDFLKPMMTALMEARAAATKQYPDVTIGVTGLPTFAYGDLRVLEKEMLFSFRRQYSRRSGRLRPSHSGIVIDHNRWFRVSAPLNSSRSDQPRPTARPRNDFMPDCLIGGSSRRSKRSVRPA